MLLVACAGSTPHSRQGQWRLDTETAGRLRHATTVAGEGASTAAPAAAPTVASVLVKTAPLLVTVLGSDNAVGELEERLWECAREAERRINARYFGGRAPTRAECGEEVVVDGCPQPITRAMQLGQQKHALALECAREVLEELWPRPFRLEQRYRYYRNAQFLEMVSREEEARLIAQGCTRELWRTIKPDIVLYLDDNWRRAALTLDFKFPCPETNVPQWRQYSSDSAYSGQSQGQIYQEALGGHPVILSPKKITP
ncbi:hypothetical protein DB31_8287 [Hyalangium minutum]|uniref:Uncharacterized protein n=1 Tax=Hyalangium minutum TaxID=394096 RepID=A0A085WJE1_9BACT|nr:hypothetical protein DB31_8287 [Hyalangium minutum]